jgi:hypothetical protein
MLFSMFHVTVSHETKKYVVLHVKALKLFDKSVHYPSRLLHSNGKYVSVLFGTEFQRTSLRVGTYNIGMISLLVNCCQDGHQ